MAPRANWQSTYRNVSRRPGASLRHPKIFTRTSSHHPERTVRLPQVPRAIWFGALVATVVSAGGWFLFFSKTFAIEDIQIIGNVNESVRTEIESLRGQNLWRYAAGDMTDRLRGSQSSIRDLVLSKGIPRTLRVEVALRDAALIWKSGDATYLVDDDGIAFQSDEVLASSIGIVPVVVDTRQQAVRASARLLRLEFLEFATELSREFPQRFPLALERLEVGDTTLELTAVTSAGWVVQLDTTRPVAVQLDALAKVIGRYHEEVKEYVDLRVPGRAYFK
ncbi:MAG: cell division protein FtsQ/DivIB [Patescibacteria group bacterium]|jgi:cell division septal protein FtsQ